MSLSSKYGPSKMVRKCTKNSKKWMSQNGVVLAAIDEYNVAIIVVSSFFEDIGAREPLFSTLNLSKKDNRVVATTPEKTHDQTFLTFETILNRFLVLFGDRATLATL